MSRVQTFDFSVDLLRALLWQYEGATGLQAILSDKKAWYEVNQTQFWTDWTRDVFNLKTANEFGLTVWGVILNLPLSIDLPGTGDRPAWGFGVHHRNFGRGNFGRRSGGTSALTLEQKRQLLRLRYLNLISDGSIPFINFTLREVFGYRSGYVLVGEDMTITYVFAPPLSPALQIMIDRNDLLPRPAGVGTSILVVRKNLFGFGPHYKNFNNGAFGA